MDRPPSRRELRPPVWEKIPPHPNSHPIPAPAGALLPPTLQGTAGPGGRLQAAEQAAGPGTQGAGWPQSKSTSGPGAFPPSSLPPHTQVLTTCMRLYAVTHVWAFPPHPHLTDSERLEFEDPSFILVPGNQPAAGDTSSSHVTPLLQAVSASASEEGLF